MPAPKDPEKRKLWHENMSKAGKKKIFTAAHRAAISTANSGKKKAPFSVIHRARMSLARTSQVGENNANWQGGISFLPYSFNFNVELKERIRERDNHTCQLCGRIKEENSNRKLTVHHIDYDKMNSFEDNLITLCNRCNSKVNFNRSHWIEFFDERIIRIYS